MLPSGRARANPFEAESDRSAPNAQRVGPTVPAWFISQVTASLNGTPVLRAHWGPAVSKNPYLQFKVKGAKAGDKIAISWKDNRGDTRRDEATVS